MFSNIDNAQSWMNYVFLTGQNSTQAKADIVTWSLCHVKLPQTEYSSRVIVLIQTQKLTPETWCSVTLTMHMATEGLPRYKSPLRGDTKIQKGKAYYVLAGKSLLCETLKLWLIVLLHV